MNDSELVMVPVPRGHLEAVYDLIATRHRAAITPAPGIQDGPTGERAIRWTADDLRRFADSGTKMTQTICALLDALAQTPGVYLSTSDLEKETGIARANIKGSLSSLTRHIRKHYERTNWMFEWQWGPDLDPSRPAETHYRLDEDAAATWREAKS